MHRMPWLLRVCGVSTFTLLTLNLSLLVLVAILEVGGITPASHPIIEMDPALSFPLQDPTVSTTWLVIISLVIPAVLCTLVEVVRVTMIALADEDRIDDNSSSYDGEQHAEDATTTKRCCRCQIILAVLRILSRLLLALMVTILLTNAVKLACGRPRPNFFALCDYKGYGTILADADHGSRSRTNLALKPYFESVTAGHFGSLSNCKAGAKDVAQAQKSFPSGHSSCSFCGCCFLALAIDQHVIVAAARALRMQTKSKRRRIIATTPQFMLTPRFTFIAHIMTSDVVRMLSAMFWCGVAAFVAASRFFDNWHFAGDVVGGSTIGTLVSVAVWWITSNNEDESGNCGSGSEERSSSGGVGGGVSDSYEVL